MMQNIEIVQDLRYYQSVIVVRLIQLTVREGKPIMHASLSSYMISILGAFQTQEEEFDRALLAGLAVIAVFFLVLYVIQRKRHRWLALFVLFLSFVLAGLLGGWKAVAAAMLSSGLAIVLSAALLRHIYDESTWDAFWHQIRMAFGRSKDIQVIDEGKTIVPKESGTLLGPRRVVIKPYNAVVTEQGAKTTGVIGPRVLDTQSFEFVKHIIDLRPKQQWVTASDVLNADLVKLEILVCVDYSIDLRDEAKIGTSPFDEAEKARLMHIAVSMKDWTRAANSAVEAAARTAFCDTTLVDLQKADKHDELEKTTKDLAQKRTAAWGINIDNLVIQRIQPSSQAVEGGETITALRQLVNVYSEAQKLGLSKDDLDRYLERHLQKQQARNNAGLRK